MKWLRHILMVVSLVVQTSVHAQCPDIPETYHWETAEDYARDKELVKKTLRWLCRTPLGEQVQQRSMANAYVLEWLAGTPEPTISIDTKVLCCTNEFPDLLYTYMHGIALYVLEHEKQKTNAELQVEGLKVVAALAAQSKEISKAGCMRKMLRAAKRGKLKEYVKKNG
ncbi:MAG: hypothetical protein ACKVOR_00835 [Flavobacteriales bacterium]